MRKLINIWNEYGFEIILFICILFICTYALYLKINKNNKGTWSKNYTYVRDFRDFKHNDNIHTRNSPPKDSKGEIECRKVLEEIFNRPFKKHRPNFLNNPVTGGMFNLELDCYNDDIGLALEYNGIQHETKKIEFFINNFII